MHGQLIISLLVLNLGADDFGTREKSHLFLQKTIASPMVQAAVAAVETDACIERRCRGRLLMLQYYDHAADWFVQSLLWRYGGKMPWLAYDVEVQEAPCVCQLDATGNGFAALASFMPVGPGVVADDDFIAWREATSRLVDALYRQRASRAEIIALLDALVYQEMRYNAIFRR